VAVAGVESGVVVEVFLGVDEVIGGEAGGDVRSVFGRI
jgi:hypothetical protein